jgi:uncharacterized delta-60 repeat protein
LYADHQIEENPMTRLLRQRTLFYQLATVTLLSSVATTALAQDGVYIVESWVGFYSDVKIQGWDQKIVTAGGSGTSVAIARYDQDRIPDGTFGNGGLSTLELATGGDIKGLILQADHKALVSCSSNKTSLAVARFLESGTVDTGFGGGGWNSLNVGATFEQTAKGVGLQSTGKVVVAGASLGTSSPSFAGVAARFTASGALDSGKGAFGDVVKGQAKGYTLFGYPYATFVGLAVQSDSKLVTVGHWDNGPGLLVARYTASGTLDKTFNSVGYSVSLTPDSYARGVALQSDGKVVVVGQSGSDMLIARFLSTGAWDTAFAGGSGYLLLDIDGPGSPTRESAAGVAIQPDGKIVAAGNVFYDAVPPTTSKACVARVNSNGMLDTTFGTGGFKTGGPTDSNSWGEAVDLQADGSIIVAGYVLVDEGGTDVQHPLLVRFDQ